MAARRAGKLRARDADRNDTCQILDGALAEGQLTMAEHRDRVAAATKAATLAELQRLVTDLQPTTGSVNGHPRQISRLSARASLLVAAAAIGVLGVVVAAAVVIFSDSDPAAPPPSFVAP